MKNIIIDDINMQIDGDNLIIKKNKIYVDGKEIFDCNKLNKNNIKIIVNGDIDNLNADCDVKIDGEVDGNVEASGSITCDDVGGNVDAGTSVTCDDVGGDVDAGTSVTCNDIGGDVDAGTSVTCSNVEGDVEADSIICDEE